MLRRVFPRFQHGRLAMAEDCIAAGSFRDALRHLSVAKGSPLNSNAVVAPQEQTAPFVDYLRALCFLRLKDPVKAHAALQEEVGRYPANEDAQDLLQRVNMALRDATVLPRCVIDSEPLFAAVYDTVQLHQDAGGCPCTASLSWPRLFSLFCHTRDLCRDGVVGDLVDCGSISPSSSIVLAVATKHFGGSANRRVIAFDACTLGEAATAAHNETLQALATQFGVQVAKLHGPFDRTLPLATANGIVGDVALLHLDCDWYGSAKAALSSLYPLVTKGGVVQIDDYNYWDGCRRAVREHFDRHGMPLASLERVDSNAVWFRKE